MYRNCSLHAKAQTEFLDGPEENCYNLGAPPGVFGLLLLFLFVFF